MTVALGARGILVAAFVVFLVSNLIHNRGGVDPAIAPAGLFLALSWWRPYRAFLVLGAICIAMPCFGFVRFNAIYAPTGIWRFLNHVALLAAGVLAVIAAGTALRRWRERRDA